MDLPAKASSNMARCHVPQFVDAAAVAAPHQLHVALLVALWFEALQAQTSNQ